jgi:pantoate--beta-alanine ligase
MSSRNAYLSPEERASALSLKKSLDLADNMVQSGERDAGKIIAALGDLIAGQPFTEVDYINLCHPETLEDLNRIEGDALLALAVHVGRARLIDNCILKAKDKE